MGFRVLIHFLLNISESTRTKEITSLQMSLEEFISSLRTDPYALETVWLSVASIRPLDKLAVTTSLTELVNIAPSATEFFNPSDQVLTNSDLSELGPQTETSMRNSVIVLVTDEEPNSSLNAQITSWAAGESPRERVTFVAICLGDDSLNRTFQEAGFLVNEDPTAQSSFLLETFKHESWNWIEAPISHEFSVKYGHPDGLIGLSDLDDNETPSSSI